MRRYSLSRPSVHRDGLFQAHQAVSACASRRFDNIVGVAIVCNLALADELDNFY
jgi:hypothetical protein